MDKVLIDIREESKIIKKHFDNKDVVSVSDLLGLIEDLDFQIDDLEEKIKDIKQDIEDFYNPKSPYEILGISERDFH